MQVLYDEVIKFAPILQLFATIRRKIPTIRRILQATRLLT